MTKEEIALQLTLANLPKLHSIETPTTRGDKSINEKYNESIAIETAKMYNTIYNEINSSIKE